MRQNLKRIARRKKSVIVKFNILFSVIDSSNRQKTGKGTVYLNSTINKLNLFGIYKIFLPIEYTFFSKLQRTFTKIDHTLGHKTPLTDV